MSNKTWVLVAHRAGARLFENPGAGSGLTLLQDMPHEQGRLKNQDLTADRQGNVADARGGHNSYQQAEEPTEHVAAQFAKELAKVLDDGRNHQKYDQLVLVAEPRFLGYLRAALSPQTAKLVTASVSKDLGVIEARDLPQHIQGVVKL
jgi:protein required for attachment to host cells